MRPQRYLRPASLAEALQALGAANGRGRPLAGGTDLIVEIREGRRAVETVVDLKAVPELVGVGFDPARGLRVGAATPCYQLAQHPVVRASYPALADVAGLIGGIQIQSRASLGGNLCTASPAADSAPALIALAATCVLAGPEGERRLPLEQFFLGPRRTVLAPTEVLVALELPPPQPGAGSAYLRFIPRNEMDIAVVGVGAWLQLAGEEVVAARIGLGAVAPTPRFARAASEALIGGPLTPERVAAAAAAAQEASAPIDDLRGSARQRRHLVGVLTRRAVLLAAERAREQR